MNSKEKGIIVSGFAGIGKSSLIKKANINMNIKIIDLDSSFFNKEFFPENYINEILIKIKNYDIVLVSTHEILLNQFTSLNIPFVLVYPEISCKQEYLKRCTDRGSSKDFVEGLDKAFERKLDFYENLTNCKKITLTSNMYLSDVLDNIIEIK